MPLIKTDTPSPCNIWLLLVFQLPAKPAYLRVKIWRRLQNIGAVTVKNSVYVLPATTETREDFQWLLNEIEDGGGDGMVCEANLIAGLSDAQLLELFNQAREADYDAIADEARALASKNFAGDAEGRAQRRSQIARLRKRLAEVVAIDFLDANGRESAEGLVAELEVQQNREDGALIEEQGVTAPCAIGTGHTWVTREGVKVDRIASAWLIRRFIDAEACLKFVAAGGYVPRPGELRFDMFEAEYTHEGDNCTFEVLLARAGLDDFALKPIAAIVHDIDIKDGKYGREETGGIKTLLASICLDTVSDEERIRRGSVVFEDLYQYFRNSKPN